MAELIQVSLEMYSASKQICFLQQVTCISGAINPVLTSPTAGLIISRNAASWHVAKTSLTLSYVSGTLAAWQKNNFKNHSDLNKLEVKGLRMLITAFY